MGSQPVSIPNLRGRARPQALGEKSDSKDSPILSSTRWTTIGILLTALVTMISLFLDTIGAVPWDFDSRTYIIICVAGVGFIITCCLGYANWKQIRRHPTQPRITKGLRKAIDEAVEYEAKLRQQQEKAIQEFNELGRLADEVESVKTRLKRPAYSNGARLDLLLLRALEDDAIKFDLSIWVWTDRNPLWIIMAASKNVGEELCSLKFTSGTFVDSPGLQGMPVDSAIKSIPLSGLRETAGCELLGIDSDKYRIIISDSDYIQVLLLDEFDMGPLTNNVISKTRWSVVLRSCLSETEVHNVFANHAENNNPVDIVARIVSGCMAIIGELYHAVLSDDIYPDQ